MSEFDETRLMTGEIPRFSPHDIQDNNSSDVIEVDVNVDDLTIEDMWQFNEPISEDAIAASAVRDELIRGRYDSAKSTVESISQFAETARDKIIDAAHANIQETQQEFAEWYEEQENAKRINIAAIEEQFSRNVEKASFAINARIENRNAVIENVGILDESIKRAVGNLNREIEGGVKAQTKHEARRSVAVRIINALVDEYTHKQLSLDEARQQLEKYNLALFNSEQRSEELIDEENELKAEERIEREKHAAPLIQKIRVQFGIDPSLPEKELSEDTQNAFSRIRKDVRSQALSEILGRIIEVNEKQKHAKRSIANNISLAESTELEIARLEERLKEIPLKIDEERKKLAFELEKVSKDLEIHSSDAGRVIETFDAISRGDITEVARDAIPVVLRPVWTNVRAVQSALSRDTQIDELPEPDFDTNILLPLRDDTYSEPYNVSDIRGGLETLQNHEEDIELVAQFNQSTAFFGKIGRRLLQAGSQLHYRVNKDETQHES
jgi:hypothetical protein